MKPWIVSISIVITVYFTMNWQYPWYIVFLSGWGAMSFTSDLYNAIVETWRERNG